MVSTIVFGLTVRSAGLVIALPMFVVLSSFASRRFRWRYSVPLAA